MDLGALLGWKKYPILLVTIFPPLKCSYSIGPIESAILGFGIGHNPKKVVVLVILYSRILKTLKTIARVLDFLGFLNTLPACDDLSFKMTRSSSEDSII